MANTGKENSNEVNYKAFLDESAEDLYENAPCGYVSTLPDGTIIKINHTLLAWTGHRREEVLFLKRFQDFLSIGGKIFYETHHAPFLQMQGFVNEINYDIIRRGRTNLPVLANAIMLKDNDGNPALIRTTLFNITDRKKYELELLHAKRKAEQAAKAKAEFLSTVSHEIRTPMNAIIGITNLLLEANPKSEQLEFLRILKVSSSNLLNLINDILDFSKIESGKISLEEKPFNLPELIQSLLYSLQVRAEEKGLAFHIYLDSMLPDYVKADSVKLGQILTNLVGNAIKFTEKGHITIELETKEVTSTDALIEFTVTDTGIGIPSDKLEQIFEEFSQASQEISQQYGGTGLGLTISQRLLHLFGSKMKVESELGKGSTFHFSVRLNLSLDPIPAKAGPKEDLKNDHSIEGVSLLVVEDNTINVFVITQYLTNWGVLFDVVENGIQAVEKVQQKNYDLVLMDLQLPGLNGYDASLQIRNLPGEKYKQLPIIALSGSTKIGMEERIEQAGMNTFVSKPFEPQELFAKIALYSKRSRKTSMQLSDVQPTETLSASASPPTTAISLTQYLKLTKNKKNKLTELLQITIEDFAEFKEELKKALQARNEIAYEAIAHKSKMTVNLLEAIQLISLINQGASLLQSGNSSDTEIQTLVYLIEKEIDIIILELKQALP